MAEGVFQSLVKQSAHRHKIGQVDSCGTAAYHAGEGPDTRTMSTLEYHGIRGYKHRARKLQAADLDTFDYVFAMDEHNLADVRRLQRGRPESKARVMLFGAFSGSGEAEQVEDPYYGGREGFKKAYEQCVRFGRNFLKEVVGDEKGEAKDEA